MVYFCGTCNNYHDRRDTCWKAFKTGQVGSTEFEAKANIARFQKSLKQSILRDVFISHLSASQEDGLTLSSFRGL